MQKVNFHLPSLFYHWNMISYILFQFRNNPHFFYDWVNIDSCYDAPFNNLLSSGRSFFQIEEDKKDIIYNEVVEFCKKYDCGVTLILSNSLITEEHLSDEGLNNVLEKFHNEKNSIVLASDILEEYIRKNYPLYKINSSVTKVLNKEDIVKELEKDYNLVCLLHDYNKDYDFLASLPHPERIELMPNHSCNTDQLDKCRAHYKFMSKNNLNGLKGEEASWLCPYQNGSFYNMIRRRHTILPEEIPTYAERFGITNFKISGRHLNEHDLFEGLTYYLVKPERQMEFRTIYYIGK